MTVLPALPDHPTVLHGDCVEQLRLLPDDSVDAVVCDPPYNLAFMGKAWDAHPSNVDFQEWCGTWLAECLRVLKPGGHLLAFGGTRTWHRLACAVEDVGFEIRDSIAWMYGSGFPKSLNVGKAIDKAAGATREVVGSYKGASNIGIGSTNSYITTESGHATDVNITTPATAEAQQWEGWGTALKPAFEPIVVARKPIVGTVASNVLAHGTGGLNIDGTRVGNDEMVRQMSTGRVISGNNSMSGSNYARADVGTVEGRWPGNVMFSHHESCSPVNAESDVYECVPGCPVGELGDKARFFYTAKASKQERPNVDGVVAHPTVKPLAIMRWLVRLATQPGGLVLDPFAGSGTTVEACMIEGFRCLAIEKEAEYLPLIEARIARNDLSLFGGVSE